jgi:hypothetical protein
MVDREREELEEGLNAATAEAHAAAVDEELSIGLKSKEIVRTAVRRKLGGAHPHGGYRKELFEFAWKASAAKGNSLA